MRKSKYSAEQLQFIKDNVVNPQKKLAEMFNENFNVCLSDKAISSLKKRLHIKSGLKGGSRKFTDEQIAFIKENIVNPEKKLAEMVNKKFGTTYDDISIANLKTRLHLKSGLVGGQFQKGQIPKNKGKKWHEFMSKEGQEKSLKTCFKKGNVPHNHKPVGSERITKDGYIEIKIAEPRKWKAKHRIVWEQHNGKVPQGYHITFLDGNKQNCEIENLQLVGLAENLIMNRKGFYSNHREITESGLALASLINGINKKVKNENK